LLLQFWHSLLELLLQFGYSELVILDMSE
jgi:hypothetical protein